MSLVHQPVSPSVVGPSSVGASSEGAGAGAGAPLDDVYVLAAWHTAHSA